MKNNSELMKKIESLEIEKENILFFQEKEDILTTRWDKYLKQTNTSVSIIPVKFIMDLNGIQNDRNLYVLDFIGIRNTHNVYPANMDPEMYMKFIMQVDAALTQNGLSTLVKMSNEQRKIFDDIIRKREEEQKGMPQILEFAEWYALIRKKVYYGIPQQIEMHLNNKNKNLLNQITSYVANKCSYVKLNDEVITQFTNEALKELGITLKDLRYLDKEQWQKGKRMPIKRK